MHGCMKGIRWKKGGNSVILILKIKKRQISKFEASLVYGMSSRTTRVTQRNPVSGEKKKERKKEKKKTSQGRPELHGKLVSLSYIVRFCLQNKTNNNKTKNT